MSICIIFFSLNFNFVFLESSNRIFLRKTADRINRRTSPIIQRTSVLVLEDRPLPELPADASDLSDVDESIDNNGCLQTQKQTTFGDDLTDSAMDNDAVYINTCTSTNDSGLGGSSRAPQDYANANFCMFFNILLKKIF